MLLFCRKRNKQSLFARYFTQTKPPISLKQQLQCSKLIHRESTMDPTNALTSSFSGGQTPTACPLRRDWVVLSSEWSRRQWRDHLDISRRPVTVSSSQTQHRQLEVNKQWSTVFVSSKLISSIKQLFCTQLSNFALCRALTLLAGWWHKDQVKGL